MVFVTSQPHHTPTIRFSPIYIDTSLRWISTCHPYPSCQKSHLSQQDCLKPGRIRIPLNPGCLIGLIGILDPYFMVYEIIPEKTNPGSILDPYFMVYEIIPENNWVVFHPVYTLNNKTGPFCSLLTWIKRSVG